MNSRQLKKFLKENGCIYSDAEIDKRIREMGSIKRWEIYISPVTIHDIGGDIDNCGVVYNRVAHQFMDTNFNVVRQIDGIWKTEKAFEHENAVPLVQSDNSSRYFTREEKERIEHVLRQHNCWNNVHSYGAGNATRNGRNLYDEIGILKTDENDNSFSFGFEIETNVDVGMAGHYHDNDFRFNPYLGHMETDGSISGVEWDSHTFSYNRLQVIKPLIREEMINLMEQGLLPTTGAGLHIHVGRDAFASEEAFQKFYYIINVRDNESAWSSLARRNQTSYSLYRHLDRGNRTHLINSIRAHADDHGVAVNQQHNKSYEIRIFQSTLNVEILFANIEIIKRLVDFCNGNDTMFKFSKILQGEQIGKLLHLIHFGNPVIGNDLSFLTVMTREQAVAAMQEALSHGDLATAMSLGQQFQNQGGAQ